MILWIYAVVIYLGIFCIVWTSILPIIAWGLYVLGMAIVQKYHVKEYEYRIVDGCCKEWHEC